MVKYHLRKLMELVDLESDEEEEPIEFDYDISDG